MTLRGVALTLVATVLGLAGCSQKPPLPFPSRCRRLARPARARRSP
jgi:predicted small lipoprotein YifL